MVLVEHRCTHDQRLAVGDEAHVEARPPDVGCDDVVRADQPAERGSTEHAARRARAQERHGAPLAGLGAAHTAEGLHDDGIAGEAAVGEAFLQLRDVGVGGAAEVAVEHGGGAPLVLLDDRRHLVGDRHEKLGVARPDELGDGPLVGGIEEAPQEADGNRLDAARHELRDGSGGFVEIYGHHHRAPVVDPLGDALDERPRHDRGGLLQVRQVAQLRLAESGRFLDRPPDDDGVLVPLGRDQADDRARPGEEGVGGDRCAMTERARPSQEFAEIEAVGGCGALHRLHDTLGEVRRRGGGLRSPDAPCGVEGDTVGERAAAVDGDEPVHAAQAGPAWRASGSGREADRRRSSRTALRRNSVAAMSTLTSSVSRTTP